MKPFPTFTEFFRAIWINEPFPWQDRLAGQISVGGWPEWITLPTGTGKTAAIDIAIYDLARQASRPEAKRSAPVRIVFAVNRRIVVDEAYERAKKIGDRIRAALDAEADVLFPVASALRALAGPSDTDASPLEVFPLRGGTFSDHSWARTPTQPLVISTTLDQLGSRLLFRGYGVSEHARPIHAALLANDALLILDEAHTAKAFSQTLRALAEFKRLAKEDLNLPFAAVQLTATPPADVTGTFALEDEDGKHPPILARLNAAKPAKLVAVEGAKGSARHRMLAEKMAAKAIEFLDEGNRRVLIVVNRVATAAALKAVLSPDKGNRGHDAVVEVLTGRLRPLDRQNVIQELDAKFQLKSSSPSGDVPRLILIATQCIEVGADFDFDALVTELAPLDSLRQRFGRLNRHGREIPAPATIFAPEEALENAKPDPLYGACLPLVWAWLGRQIVDEGTIDFGLRAMSDILPGGEEIAGLLAPAPDAPVLLEPHLDLLCQTSPEPHISPDPALYIHGPGRNFPEVSVVLRADLGACGDVPKMLGDVQPLAAEAATVPLHLAREWLADPSNAKDSTGDAPEDVVDPWTPGEITVASAYRYSGGKAEVLNSPNDLKPGDTLVLTTATPAEHLSKLFPIPAIADVWALDQYERAYLISKDRLAIRFHTGIRDALEIHLKNDPEIHRRYVEIVSALFAKDEEEERWIFREKIWTNALPELSALLACHLPDQHPMKFVWQFAAQTKEGLPRPSVDWTAWSYPENTFEGVVFINRSRVGAANWPFDPEDLGQQGNSSTGSVPLATHSEGVSRRAFANARDLPDMIASVLRDAGAWHDLGKLDPRFQAMLHGCSLWAVFAKEEKLAKSAPRGKALDAHFRSLAGLPDGFRHELLSALIVLKAMDEADYPDLDLLVHLIASHHGRCRAMAPVIPDTQPMPFEVQVNRTAVSYPGHDAPLAHLCLGVARRFWLLTRRFGWWGLPYLETMLRLADQYESANPSPPTTP